MNGWEYGIVELDEFGNTCAARRKGSRVQFVLWKAGQHGHKEDFWHNMGAGWSKKFSPVEPRAPSTGGEKEEA